MPIRYLDHNNFINIPEEIIRLLRASEGDGFEFSINDKNEIILRQKGKSFEECVFEWYEKNHRTAFRGVWFRHEGNYTFCIVHFKPWDMKVSRAGFAKKYEKDSYNDIIGKVAAYANAMGYNLNKMIKYKGE